MKRALIVICLQACTSGPTPLPRSLPARPRQMMNRQAVPSFNFRARQVVPRLGGGAFMLGPDGELARVNRRGELTGSYATPLVGLFAIAQFVCGQDEDESLYCAVDHHADFSCPTSADGLALQRVNQAPGGPLTHDRATNTLCAAPEGQAPRCFRVLASCEAHCLSWPPCGPARCIDPCAPGGLRELRAVAVETKFSSSSPT